MRIRYEHKKKGADSKRKKSAPHEVAYRKEKRKKKRGVKGKTAATKEMLDLPRDDNSYVYYGLMDKRGPAAPFYFHTLKERT